MSASAREHLLGTISHLTTRREVLRAEVAMIEEVLKALYREEQTLPRTESLVFPPSEGEYAGISIRWAIFQYLATHARGPEPLGSIADALRAGGSITKALNFNSNVSAVLSQMVAKGELTKGDAGFALTAQGEATWNSIRVSEKFINRRADSGDTNW